MHDSARYWKTCVASWLTVDSVQTLLKVVRETSPNQAAVSTSVSSPTNSASAAKKNRSVKRWMAVCSTIVLTFALFIVIRTQGFVSGQEFSPTHFQQRNFSFYEIPLIHVQITPIKRVGSTPATATYVRQNALIRPHTGAPTSWHLVSISRGLTGSTAADANLLIDQLQLQTGVDEFWRTWSIDHPKLAKVLWPVIQKLAERELYILMPQLFELAQIDQTPQQLQQNIDELLRGQYRSLIQDMQAADRGELAKQLLAEASKDYPQDAELKNLRLSLPE